MNNIYKITGGKTLKGNVVLSGAKNVSLKTIIAALMFKGDVILENIPQINDVIDLLEMIRSIGAKAEFIKKNTVLINGDNIKSNRLDLLFSSKIRVSFMMFAPLLAKFSECYLPNPGGCRIGARPIDRIIAGMEKLGIKVVYNSTNGYYHAKLSKNITGKYAFEKPSHTGTELLMLLGLLTEDEVVIENAACEPEIDDLILFLNLSGADIKKENKNIIVRKGKTLVQNKPYCIISDRNEFVTYATLAVASKGDVVIGPIDEELVSSFLHFAAMANVGIEKLKENKFRFFYQGDIKPVDIETLPHPGFMTDWQPSWAILMLFAKGKSTIHERVFENRFSYMEELKKLGAKMDFIPSEVKDPKNFYFFNYDSKKEYQQKIAITGVEKLHNGVLTVHDLRAGAALACAALLAPGLSIVNGVSILERGYEDFVGKISRIGGKIEA